MPLPRFAFLLVPCLLACSKPSNAPASAPSSPPIASGAALTFVENVEPLAGDAPLVEVIAGDIRVDGVAAGSTRSIEETARLAKVDDVYRLLKAKRETWKQLHPGEPFSGVVRLRFEANVKAVVVLSVFQTAAFAGYPNACFVVHARPTSPAEASSLACLSVEAEIPGPPSEAPAEPERVLRVELPSLERAVLRWKEGDTTVSVTDVPLQAGRAGFVELGEKIKQEWRARGVHKDPADRRRDRLIVLVDQGIELHVLTALLDAAAATRRSGPSADGRKAESPAFDVTLSARGPSDPELGKTAVVPENPGSAKVRVGAVTVSGRLPAEVVQRIVRQSFGRFRGCYDDARKRDPSLHGRIALAFTITEAGAVANAKVGDGSDLRDKELASCLVATIAALSFPAPETGSVKVVYPITFSPHD